jgi:hypothetical protein
MPEQAAGKQKNVGESGEAIEHDHVVEAAAGSPIWVMEYPNATASPKRREECGDAFAVPWDEEVNEQKQTCPHGEDGEWENGVEVGKLNLRHERSVSDDGR